MHFIAQCHLRSEHRDFAHDPSTLHRKRRDMGGIVRPVRLGMFTAARLREHGP